MSVSALLLCTRIKKYSQLPPHVAVMLLEHYMSMAGACHPPVMLTYEPSNENS